MKRCPCIPNKIKGVFSFFIQTRNKGCKEIENQEMDSSTIGPKKITVLKIRTIRKWAKKLPDSLYFGLKAEK